MKSAEENPTIVDEYLAKEVGWGRLIGPVIGDTSIPTSQGSVG